ncbi:MAG: hypothetical protein LUD47_07665 [Clostridia bacterium]|nr:hypothetical protein [Clostridia bacterium]
MQKARNARDNMIRRILRLDADEDEDRESPKGHGGNTRIPFGLCKRFNIDLPEGASPKDAWDALEGKGINSKAVYQYLEKNGTVKGFEPKKKTSKPAKKAIDIDTLNLSGEDRKTFTGFRDKLKNCFDKWKKELEDNGADYRTYDNFVHDRPEWDAVMRHMENKYDKRSDEGKAIKSTYATVRALTWYFSGLNTFENIKDSIENKKGDVAFWKDSLNDKLKWMDAEIAKTDGCDSEISGWLKTKRDELQRDLDNVDEMMKQKAAHAKEDYVKGREKFRAECDKNRGKKRKTKLVEHRTFDSVEDVGKALGMEGNMSNVMGLGKASPDAIGKANEIYSTLQTLEVDYDIKPQTIAMGTYQDKALQGACAAWEYGASKLYLVNLEYKGNNEIKNSGYGFKRIVVNYSPRGSVTHEMGHGVMEKKVVSEIDYHDTLLMDEWLNNARKSVYDEHGKDLADGTMSYDEFNYEVEKTAKDYGSLFQKYREHPQAVRLYIDTNQVFSRASNNGDIEKYLSKYSATNTHEFFAECFTAYALGEELPDYMIDLVEEYLD